MANVRGILQGRSSSVALMFVFIALCGNAPGAADKSLEDVTAGGGIYAELASFANRWLDAVRMGDVDALAEAVLPEAKSHAREALRSSDSALSRILLSGQHSVRRRFRNLERPGVRLLKHPDLAGLGEGTSACFYDPKRPPRSMPHTLEELPRPDSAQTHFCLFFFRDDGRWYASYDFAEAPDA